MRLVFTLYVDIIVVMVNVSLRKVSLTLMLAKNVKNAADSVGNAILNNRVNLH